MRVRNILFILLFSNFLIFINAYSMRKSHSCPEFGMENGETSFPEVRATQSLTKRAFAQEEPVSAESEVLIEKTCLKRFFEKLNFACIKKFGAATWNKASNQLNGILKSKDKHKRLRELSGLIGGLAIIPTSAFFITGQELDLILAFTLIKFMLAVMSTAEGFDTFYNYREKGEVVKNFKKLVYCVLLGIGAKTVNPKKLAVITAKVLRVIF